MNSNSKKVRVLVVDDDRTIQFLLQAQLEDLGHEAILASDGLEGWGIINEQKIDVLLLDREMPKMNGLDVVFKMKNDPILAKIPIIMQTGDDKPEQIKQGIDAGVYYYLTKPINLNILKSVLSAAVREVQKKQVLSKELQQHKDSFRLIHKCTFYFKKLIEAESLACFVANCFPEPQKVVTGLADLLINAVEHGNLSIGYDYKTKLLEQGKWREEVNNLSEKSNKEVKVILEKKENGIQVVIIDEGKGFNWKEYLQIDPSRAQDNHGRGIAQANALNFDSLKFNDKGNEVTVFVNDELEIEW